MTAVPGGQVLHGDWRRRRGTKTDAHLWGPSERSSEVPGVGRALPLCRKLIHRGDTERLHSGRPCSDCLVAAIRKAGSK